MTVHSNELIIRPAQPDDADAIWDIFSVIIRDGTTFLYDEQTRREDILAAWYAPAASSFVACDGPTIAGAYTIRPNHPGRGTHIANATYMVAEHARGRGAGRLMGQHSLVAARKRGFIGMQYNAVVSTNANAVHLWQSIGFAVVGRAPRAFRHPQLGLVDLLIMYRDLDDITIGDA